MQPQKEKYNPFNTTNSIYGNFFLGTPRNLPKDLYKNPYNPIFQGFYPLNYATTSTSINKIGSQTVEQGLFRGQGNDVQSQVVNLCQTFVGLDNYIENCYINSTLQILAHTKAFVSAFYQELSNIQANPPISKALYELFVKMENSQDGTSITPKKFIDEFVNIHRNYKGQVERDSQEFCRDLLQDINVELNKRDGKAEPKMQDIPDKIAMYNQFITDYNAREESIVTKTFLGDLAFELECTNCGEKYFNFNQFLDLPLYLPNNGELDLMQIILETFNRRSSIEKGDECRKCKGRKPFTHSFKAAKLPNVLMFSLQRFDFENKTKNSAGVHVDEIIDLKNIVDREVFTGGSTRFELFGINHHTGSLREGHYYADIKINGNWFTFNDYKVDKVEPDFNSQTAYILFYRKI